MAKGYVKIHRKLLDSDISKMGWKAVGFATWCIMRANFADAKIIFGKGVHKTEITIKRGQFISSLRKMAEAGNVSMQELRTLLDNLEATHFLTQESTNAYTLITLIKYGQYQDSTK